MKLTSNFVCLSLGALCALLPVAQVAAGGDPGAPDQPYNNNNQWPTTTQYPGHGGPADYPPPNPPPPPPPPGHGDDGKPYGDNGPDGKGPDGYNGGDNKPYGQDGKPYGGDGKPPGSQPPNGWKPPPPYETQVLWGQCGGYYYYGTTKCPDNAYCHKFSDWYSQCNLKGQ